MNDKSYLKLVQPPLMHSEFVELLSLRGECDELRAENKALRAEWFKTLDATFRDGLITGIVATVIVLLLVMGLVATFA